MPKAAAEGTMDLELAKAASVEAAKAVEAAEAVAVAIQAADGARERAKEADAKVTAAAEGATDIELLKRQPPRLPKLSRLPRPSKPQ